MGKIVDFWNRWGIRKQLTAIAVVLVAVPLVLGIGLFANLLTRTLSASLVTTCKEETRHVAAHIAENGLPGLSETFQLDDGYRAQVVDPAGRVVWAWPARYRQPLSTARPAGDAQTVEGQLTWWGPGDNESDDVVVARGATHQGTHYVVLVETSQTHVQDAVTTTTGLLLVAIPLVMLATGIVSWWVAGRSLRPVDRMIDRVSTITSSTLDERLPLPPANDELRSLASTMNEMLGRLETAHESQTRFVSDASHELRSPLASLSGALEIARAEDDLDTWREMSPLMHAETDRMTHLVQSLLTLSRNDAASLNLHLAETDLDDIAFQEAAHLRVVTGHHVATEVRPVRLRADPMMLHQVVRNLCDNAARHARHEVLISVRGNDGVALLRVEDDGNGVAPEDRGRIFERFVRLEESRNRDEGGSGLGLAIVAQIVAAHGGAVRVLDSSLGGACFEVRLPVTE